MKNNNKGYSLVEIILVTVVVSILSVGVYSTYASKYATYLVNRQATDLVSLMDNLVYNMNTISDTNPATGTPAITALVGVPTNLISAKMIPIDMVLNPTTLVNSWGGTVVMQGVSLPTVFAGPNVPQLSVTLSNITEYACAALATNDRLLQRVQYIFVNGIQVKAPGTPTPNQVTLAASCVATNSLQFTTDLFKKGQIALTSTGAPAFARQKETKYNIVPPGQNTVTSGVAAATCSGGSTFDAVSSACVCPNGTDWNGLNCVAFGTPGDCPAGQGWSIANNACQALGGASVAATLQGNRYVPTNVGTPVQITTTNVSNCNGAAAPITIAAAPGALPVGAPAGAQVAPAVATNPAGNYDGNVCQLCTDGTWSVDRCVTP